MLKKAKFRLILNHPFFASTALKMEYEETNSVETMSVCGKKIKFNPDFVRSISLNECSAVIAHEILHYLFLHTIRGKGKDAKDWNIACDYAVNPVLKQSGFTLPADHLDNPEFHGKTAEEIYQIIHKDSKPKPEDGESQSENGSGNQQSQSNEKGNGKPEPQDWGKVEQISDNDNPKQTEAEAKKDAVEAMNMGKMAGRLPGSLQEIISEIIEPKQNWKELLLKFIAEKAKNDYSWTFPNKRYIQQGVYLPSLESLELGHVAFAIDTSCSVDKKLLAEFVAEIREASSLFSFPVTVIHCDTKVQKVEELDEDSVINPVGRGGTSFRPVFDYANENLPDTKALVYFTDGECWDKLEEPEYEVLWVIYNNKNFKPQFGTVIYIEYE